MMDYFSLDELLVYEWGVLSISMVTGKVVNLRTGQKVPTETKAGKIRDMPSPVHQRVDAVCLGEI